MVFAPHQETGQLVEPENLYIKIIVFAGQEALPKDKWEARTSGAGGRIPRFPEQP